ncbi:MAG TPA: 3-phosphoshikimate 1-carboxyvinyltransferase [Actinomycetota bacterium]|nr:3-phosphoshikimate 1-carboxyvinyltransferase [Actinomycetota bacterium]
MRALVRPGSSVGGEARVPGDKSIAHRWVILTATARGRSELRGVPASLDLLATLRCAAALFPRAIPAESLFRPEVHSERARPTAGGYSPRRSAPVPPPEIPHLSVEGEGREAMEEPPGALDCGNSGTTMRLLAGVVASRPVRAVMVGDASLSRRPMERVAEPLRRMGARVATSGGRPPLVVEGAALRGIHHRSAVPSAQVKGCVLLAGLDAEGTTTVEEPAPTRDHTERALAALGAPVEIAPGRVRVSRFRHEGFSAAVPGDVSSAAFLIAAAALTGSELVVRDVGLNPSRTRFLEVFRRMGIRTEASVRGEELGEPVGDLRVLPATRVVGTEVPPEELPLVIDEVPVLAAVAAHAEGGSRFAGGGELRVKESDRLGGIAEGLRGLGAGAAVEGDDLLVAGGGVAGGSADARGDHRLAMAFVVAALSARAPCEVRGVEAASVSFPGFLEVLSALGAAVEAEP